MNVVSPALSPASVATPSPIRVMVVDDAVVMRSLVTRWVTESPDLVMAGALKNGREAINELERANPDVVVLDVDMPELDGISTLPLLLEKRRDLTVLMASSLTRHNAEITLKALSLGAADYIPKPDNEGGIMTSANFQRELIEKIRVLGARRTRRIPSPSLAPGSPPAARPASSRLMPANDTPRIGRPHVSPSGGEPSIIRLRPFASVIPRVLLIGASTGGPNALVEVLPKMLSVMENAPVLITQHMPPTFTIILAEHLSRACGKQVHEAVDGEPVLTGSTYLAPGGRHMRVARRAGVAVIALDDSPPVNFCKPSVDPLFASAAEVWGAWNLALVMTGMGSDGAHGAADVVAAGGSVIAQDEATSVIWGMPGAVAEAGLCSAVLALHHIAPTAVRLFQGGRP
jgi:two-component system, chemotaxis family, protein-glutamate methylesterase/glutaminase